ncbi:MAG: DUF3352 domain-containing protein [Solirubrobacterales bacterium]
MARAPVEAGREAWERWLDLSIYTRRRLGVAAGVLAVIALVWFAAVPALPCGAPGGDACAPTDHAIDLVPDDALAYAHFNLDGGSDSYQAAQDIAAQLPTLAQQAIGRLTATLPGPHGRTLDFGRDVGPWFGGEAALAILPAGGQAAQEVELLEVADEHGASEFADSLTTGHPRTVSQDGVKVQVDPRGVATALAGGFLAIGTRSGVRKVVDARNGAGGARSLADDPSAGKARGALSEDRVADLYVSKDGIARLVAEPRAPLAGLASVVDPGASTGAAAALVAGEDGLELEIRSILDPERASKHPGVFSTLPSFGPTLAGSLPSDSLGYVGIGEPGRTIEALLQRASASEPGLVAALGKLAERLKGLATVDLQRDLLPSLGTEAAIAVAPAPGHGSKAPVLTFVASGVDESRAGKALAVLQGPLAKALDPSGHAAAFKKRRIGDATAYSLRVSPTVEVTYALVDSTLVVATDPAGVRAVTGDESSLDDADPFKAATAGLPSDVSALGYLNLGGLISLGEQAGLAANPAYQTFAPELRRLQALGVAVNGSSDELATDARLVVGQEAAGSGGSPSD